MNVFETSCFDGHYITGDIDEAFLANIEARRKESMASREESQGMVDLNLNVAEQNLVRKRRSPNLRFAISRLCLSGVGGAIG